MPRSPGRRIWRHFDFCRHAEACGIDSLLTAFGFHRADPIALAAALGVLTERITFMVAVRSGVCMPTARPADQYALGAHPGPRVAEHRGRPHAARTAHYGDFLSHDERYERTDEFLIGLPPLLGGRRADDVHREALPRPERPGEHAVRLDTRIGAGDLRGRQLGAGRGAGPKHADCLWRLPDAPDRLSARSRHSSTAESRWDCWCR